MNEDVVRCGECKHCEANPYFGICMSTTAHTIDGEMFIKPVRLTTTCGMGERK